MEEKYRSSNIASFKNSPTWKIPVFAATTSDLDVSKLQSCEGIAMVGVKDVDWTKLFDYDAKFTVGYRRDGFLKSFMSLESAYAKVEPSQNSSSHPACSEIRSSWELGSPPA